MSTNRRLGLGLGLPLGVVALALVAAFGVLLPKAQGSAQVTLPDTLPGGWSAVDEALPSDQDATAVERRADAVAYVNDVYADVYDEPVAFRVYSDEDLQKFGVVTVFTGESLAFGSPNGVADPEAQQLARASTELVREGEAICLVNYQPVPEGQDASAGPLTVTCQLPASGHTVQVTTNEESVEATVDLTHDVADVL